MTAAIQSIGVQGFEGSLLELDFGVRRIPGGSGVAPVSTRESESVLITAAGIFKAIFSRDGGPPTVQLDGAAVWSFSDQRAFGVLIDGKTPDGRAGIDRDGNGHLGAFTVDSGLLDEVEEQRGRFGKLRGLTVLGDVGALYFDATGVGQADGSFKRASNEDLLAAVKRFASQGPAA